MDWFLYGNGLRHERDKEMKDILRTDEEMVLLVLLYFYEQNHIYKTWKRYSFQWVRVASSFEDKNLHLDVDLLEL